MDDNKPSLKNARSLKRVATQESPRMPPALRERTMSKPSGKQTPAVPYYGSDKPNNPSLLVKLEDSRDNKIQESESFTVEVTREITRQEAETTLQDILDLFKNEKATSVTEVMVKSIKLEHMMVLSREDKSYIRKWAKSVGDTRVLWFLEQSRDELDQYHWIEMAEKPMPALWSTSPAYTIWKEVKDLLGKKGDHELIQKKLSQLLGAIFEDQEKRSPDAEKQKQIVEQRGVTSALERGIKIIEQQHLESKQLLLSMIQRNLEIIKQRESGDCPTGEGSSGKTSQILSLVNAILGIVGLLKVTL